ncbi:4-hydroxyphenylpyruvate dioxygenase [Cyclonatronum proteinivorum]|uniref:4-hydroxyphenylpyruvate dioxygenase n=1 Tax=Cyclonatronum proteinivorum TaxID=1457365 RepID=A0A345UKQ3_9BACT|nr:4-hydroxyphenylpyruvate dioxygenase [Cyclonatronum proteinivorum]AXJ01055.1 4-hydroxyphenylpyruvate dioxygenase [Cyclonatronum proteinivorum]
MSTNTGTEPVLDDQRVEAEYEDHLGLIDIDFVELYVNNAKQAAHYYIKSFGYNVVAYRGLETGVRDKASYLLEQGNIRLVLTSPLTGDSEIAEHIRVHGDGVKDIAMQVKDVHKAYHESMKRGAESALEPTEFTDEHGTIIMAGIKTYGDTIHTFINRSNYNGIFFPGFKEMDYPVKGEPVGIEFVDHCVGNVELGKMNHWVKFYEDVLGFTQYLHFDDNDIATEYSALMSKVMAGGRGRIKFPINEPAEGKKKSQIEEYLDFYGGAGVQHVALLTSDIVDTVSKLQANGVQFLHIPTTYYKTLEERVGKIDENIDDLERLGILVDRDEEGYLLQIFTKPVSDRPTLFYEIIQRKGARGFGVGNFKALFESIEREQAVRGNL